MQKTYHLTRLDELEALAPEFDWRAYIVALGGSDVAIAETIVRQPSYRARMSAVLAEVPIGNWRSWLAARVLAAASRYLSAALVRCNFEFFGRVLSGTPQQPARWKRAVAFVEAAMGEAVGWEYVARHFAPSSTSMVDELVGRLIQAYRESISQLSWMTSQTKERAYGKLAAFRASVISTRCRSSALASAVRPTVTRLMPGRTAAAPRRRPAVPARRPARRFARQCPWPRAGDSRPDTVSVGATQP